MESKNDAPKIIIQLSLGALVYYLFTFKYKDILIETLSLQVYYQLLVLVVITNSYFAKWIDSFRSFLCHEWMMRFSKKYKAKHYKSKAKSLVEKSKMTQLSEVAQKMIDEISDTDLELENEISDIHKEINKFKEKT
ncbi:MULTISPECIES: hypothetical protein [Serratia]|uniref:hypothetical protein n=1 Tax=Serratia TaxID=613 RepID=UPI000E57ED03|nr:hypothetical protein [Serratia marcescens]AXX20248.1 hypothetical protein C7M66_14045 [Serratia marcescens]AXX26921.1 hypothetical protein C7M65_23955 [Serratia marcescens]MDP8861406.1 hypothetical protein [Serratia marcescens]RTF01520.1 hypothetical protein C7M70_01100 [Serratia marcescens]RTF03861.1 hypothetical protein C7M68_05360 [Serratia marcescens]